jgi:ketosteroid isomerase-like protein
MNLYPFAKAPELAATRPTPPLLSSRQARRRSAHLPAMLTALALAMSAAGAQAGTGALVKPLKAQPAPGASGNRAASLSDPGAVVSAFAAHFNAGQHEALMGLYEAGSVFVAAPGQAVTSTEGIRAATGQFLALRLPIQIQVRHVFQAGDVALVVSDWAISGQSPSGDAINLAGTATDVMRRGPSGGWRYLIDNPFGGQKAQP